MAGPPLVIAIGKKPPGAADDPTMGGEPGPADDGQDIVDAARSLPPDDLAKLFTIPPDALEVMGQIPELAAFADFIQNGGKPGATDDQAPPPSDLRGQIGAAVQKSISGPQGAWFLK
jgi:hypothetical protein